MPLDCEYPGYRAGDRWLTFKELRELVQAAMHHGVPDDAIVRAQTVPFRMADLGNPRGGIVQALALDQRPEQ